MGRQVLTSPLHSHSLAQAQACMIADSIHRNAFAFCVLRLAFCLCLCWCIQTETALLFWGTAESDWRLLCFVLLCVERRLCTISLPLNREDRLKWQDGFQS